MAERGLERGRERDLTEAGLNEAAVAALKLLAHRDSHGILMADRPVWNAWTDVVR